MVWYTHCVRSPGEIFNHLLREIAAASENTRPARVAFDLDSTLFCVSHRSQEILKVISEDPELRGEFQEICERLKAVRVLPTDWGIRAAVERLGLRAPRHLFERVRDMWAEKFFSNDYLHADRPYPGAVEFVRELAAAGAQILYLTGRDTSRMGDGTRASLRKWAFPLSDESALLMKPRAGDDDAAFKRDVLSDLAAKSESVWFFENEPVIVNLVRREVPAVRIVFVDSVHSGREPAPVDLPTIGMSYHHGSK